MRKILEEFKEFISRGNVLDLAVGVIMGGAFTSIINSLVKDVFMPVLSIITGGIDFSHLAIKIGNGEEPAMLNYGNFIAAVINFILISIVIFSLVKIMNRLVKKRAEENRKEADEEKEVTTKQCPYCREDISKEAIRCPRCTSMLEEQETEILASDVE